MWSTLSATIWQVPEEPQDTTGGVAYHLNERAGSHQDPLHGASRALSVSVAVRLVCGRLLREPRTCSSAGDLDGFPSLQYPKSLNVSFVLHLPILLDWALRSPMSTVAGFIMGTLTVSPLFFL